MSNADSDKEHWLDRVKSALGLAEPATVREGIEDALQDSENEADISDGERALLTNVLHMRDVRVANVMTPRSRIVGVSEEATFGELLASFRESEHARLLVYGAELDDTKGIVHIRDFLALLAGPGDPFADVAKRLTTRLKDAPLLRPVLFVPPSTPALDLMVRMQTKRVHLAVVIDEYGEVDGIVSMEDLVEVIVGDIDDEHDTPEPTRVAALPDGTIAASGEATLDEVSAVLGEVLPIDAVNIDVDSIGGYVAALAGRVPEAGDKVDGPNGLVFEVLEASPRLIKQLTIYPSVPPALEPSAVPK